jgi:hypothetical protein
MVLVNDRNGGGHGRAFHFDSDPETYASKSFVSDRTQVNYFDKSKNKHYRKLLPHEVKRFDAMPKIIVKNGKLFFDGKRIKTNSLRVRNIRSAFYWRGGILIVAFVNRPWSLFYHGYCTGFINFNNNTCKFGGTNYWKTGDEGDFPAYIVPTSLGISNTDQFVPEALYPLNTDITFDIQIPEQISLYETFNCVLSLTNNSNKSITLPDSLLDGFGIYSLYDHGHGRSTRLFTYSETTGETKILKPYETKKTDVAFLARDIYGGSMNKSMPTHDFLITFQRQRITRHFYWYGSLNPDDPTEFSRFEVKKEIEVINSNPYQIDTTNTDLVLDVKIPKRYGEWEKINCTISLTNKSDKPILVPNSLFEGLGIAEEFPNDKGTRHVTKRPMFPEALLSKSTLLMPLQTRESTVLIEADRIFRGDKQWRYEQIFDHPFRYIVHFYWDGLLDPSDNKKITRFTCDKPIELYWTYG